LGVDPAKTPPSPKPAPTAIPTTLSLYLLAENEKAWAAGEINR
jgi:hypothetical protein